MKISELFPSPLQAIAKARYIHENDIQYKRLKTFYGGAFCDVEITDSRYEKEVLHVALRSLNP